ncbi:hypothetical protein BC629DRAFT_1495886 [Irpex lacteus]|nr:hypothetical protein BC629DRAFT_1495886 [Irpex lacteus]
MSRKNSSRKPSSVTAATKTKTKKALNQPATKKVSAALLLQERAARSGSRATSGSSRTALQKTAAPLNTSSSTLPDRPRIRKKQKTIISDEEEEENEEEDEEEVEEDRDKAGERDGDGDGDNNRDQEDEGEEGRHGEHDDYEEEEQQHTSRHPRAKQTDVAYTAEGFAVLQQQIYAQRNKIATLRERNATLKQDATLSRKRKSRGNGDLSAEDTEVDIPTRDVETALSPKLNKEILRLGKYYCANYSMWVPVNVWDIVNDDGSESDGEDDLEDEHAQELRTWAHEIACEIQRVVPKNLRKYFENPLFGSRFLKGMRELRSDIAHKIPKNARHIFDIANVDFLDKKLRRDMPEVQALLNENAFLYAVGMTSKPKAFLRHPCIIKTLTLMLWGEGALVTGARRSTRTKATNGQLWEVETVTPALLAFSATIVFFVLSSEPEFAEHTGTTDFRRFYLKQQEALQVLEESTPRIYRKLMKYFDDGLFEGGADKATVAPSHEVAMDDIMAAMRAAKDDEDESENEDEDEEGDVGGKSGVDGAEGDN